jgi:RHS repeat-associated protein
MTRSRRPGLSARAREPLFHDITTRVLSDNTGTALSTFTYDAYGNQTGHTGTVTTPLGYDGQYTDAETGLVYLRARYYDPATGQFLARDPLVAQTGAAYGYVADSPLNGSDPSGTCIAGIGIFGKCKKKLSPAKQLLQNEINTVEGQLEGRCNKEGRR